MTTEAGGSLRDWLTAGARFVLETTVRTGKVVARGDVPPRYCRECARPRVPHGATFWTFDDPGECAECRSPLPAGQGIGCVA